MSALDGADGMFCASLYENCILKGGPNCQLLSLLFQTAVHHASIGHRVLFICDKDRFVDRGFPTLPTSFNLTQNEQILRSINIKYIENLMQLSELMANIHLFGDNVPHVIIIHDIIQYIEMPFYNKPISNTNDPLLDEEYERLVDNLDVDSTDDDDDNKNNNNNDMDVDDNDADDDDDFDADYDDDYGDFDDDDDDDDDDDNNNNPYEFSLNEYNKTDCNLLEADENLDEDGNLDYGIKVCGFLPILVHTQEFSKSVLKDIRIKQEKLHAAKKQNNNNNNNDNELLTGFLDKMIFIMGFEYIGNGLSTLYHFFRYYTFERFLECQYCLRTKIISIRKDTYFDDLETFRNLKEFENDIDNNNNNDVSMLQKKLKKTKWPTVYCKVGVHNIDMITIKPKKIKQ